MKLPFAIVAGCALIALALYLGLTYEKRTWMTSCLAAGDKDAALCETMYRASPK